MSSIAQQGAGFKDAATALRTLDLIAHRSLLYQHQLVRTYIARAQTHSHAATSPGMAAAAAVFEAWQSSTLPALRSQLRCRLGNGNGNGGGSSSSGGGFRPLVPKDVLAALQPLLAQIEAETNHAASVWGAANTDPPFWTVGGERGAGAFMRDYLASSPRAKLGNLVLGPTAGTAREEDWETVRYGALDGMVPADRETAEGWRKEELWEADGCTPTRGHLRMLVWAWSPVPTRTLVDRIRKFVEALAARM
ncbi:hypothetical protein PG997_000345 [Apiospora hydei]|uniref:Uncharacterized protein n=1 Tax=Apiospora hydei TaxID=1337664 RepID=A0ABR1XAI7_9PEZI